MLIVEDEMLLAMDLEAILEEAGGEVLATASSVKGALAALEAGLPDAVTLDMNLKENPRPRSRPSCGSGTFRSSSSPAIPPSTREDPVFRDVPVIRKPYYGPDLVRTLADLLA